MTTEAATEYRVPGTLDTARAWLASGRRQATVALALYVVISIGYFGLHVLPHLGRETVGLRDWTDPTVNIWSLAWWPYALLHGLNPLVTHALFAPDRIDRRIGDLREDDRQMLRQLGIAERRLLGHCGRRDDEQAP